jgi:hypothetical protein
MNPQTKVKSVHAACLTTALQLVAAPLPLRQYEKVAY